MSPPAATRAFVAPRRAGHRLFGATLLVGLLLLRPGPVLGHAQLISVDPADGARLVVSPAGLTLTFNEPVGLATGGVTVIDHRGAPVEDGQEIVDGAVIRQPLKPLPDGWYVASWGIVSEDGHIVRSSSVFAVGDADAATRPTPDTSDVSPLAGLTRAVTDLGTLVAGGAWAAWWLLRARTARVRRLALAATALALAATAAWAGIEWLDGGAAWAATPAAITAAIRCLLLITALVTARRAPTVAAWAAIGALVTLAAGGHAADSWFGVAAESAHLLAAVVWLGAAPAVFVTLRDPGADDATVLAVVRRFSRIAGVALVVIGVAGTLLALNLTDRLAGGLTTSYVLVLATKVALVALAACMGWAGRRHLARDPRRDRLQRLFLVDATLLVGVAVLSAALTLVGPHQGHAGHEETGSSRCSAVVGDTSIAVVVTPARIGSNDLVITGVPVGAQGVELAFRHELTGGAPLSMTAAGHGPEWHASGALPLAGPWDTTVSIRLDTFTQAAGTCVLRIEP